MTLQAWPIRMPQLLQRTAKVLRDEDARGEPAARRARLSPYGCSSHLASAFGTLTGPAVWLRLEGGGVPLAEPTAAFGERCAVGSARGGAPRSEK